MARADANNYTMASNAGASTGAAVKIPGGLYALTVEGTTPNVTLQGQSVNGTWLAIGAAISAAQYGSSSGAPLYLPAGQYRIVVNSGSAVYCYLVGVG